MRRRPLGAVYLSSFCMEMSLILKAGIQLADGISMLAADEPDNYIKSVLTEIKKDIEGGKSAHKALADMRIFPKYMVDLVEIGEKTGNLERVFSSLSEYFKRQEWISKSLRNAVVYPAVLLFMMIFVIVILITKVLPIFNDVYIQLGGHMSGLAYAIMNFGKKLEGSWLIVIGIIAGVALAVYVLSKIPFIKRAVSGFVGSRFYGWGLGRAVGKARFASAMAMTMSAGLGMEESLKMSGKMVSDRVLLQRIEKCRQDIKKGLTFGEAISNSNIFSSLHSQMIAIGFRTGSSDTVMEEIARRCGEDVSEKTERALARIEPTLVIIMSLLVGAILIAVMLPLMTIMSAI
jgi:type IV pilus assembly protein PilC